MACASRMTNSRPAKSLLVFAPEKVLKPKAVCSVSIVMLSTRSEPLRRPSLTSPTMGSVRTHPMGRNSWNHYHDHFDDKTVRKMADAMVSSGMAAVGYQYIIVDEGW